MGKVFSRSETEQEKFIRLCKKMADDDCRQYREGYPNSKDDDPTIMDNYLFFSNKIPMRPDGLYIEEILKNWFGDYEKLEYTHSYIQWLFPIRKKGLNAEAQPLQLHEAKAIRSDPQIRDRILRAYNMMLDFYGIKLVNELTGEVKRGHNWEERVKGLNKYLHNYLRITRILKFLGEAGFEDFKCPLVEFLLLECLKEKSLTEAKISLRDYWSGVLRNEADRTYILRLLSQFWPDYESF
ncbi:opioid growth factor receptor-like protein 1 isoform X1 [Tachypleus tridentatus]|uniref:opioid growth factor receptor-like protein 1 isoform X1 n=2 Tax=Tachypleus tridentatus TaxID=6853 RepID=UPI003FD0427A